MQRPDLLVLVVGLLIGIQGATQSTTKTYRDLEVALMYKDSVRILDLSGKRLREFPISIFELKGLEVLKLNRCKLDSLPMDWPLEGLRVLDVSNNRLTGLPKGIFGLKELEKLKVGQNDLSTLPDDIRRLRNLEILDLWGNDIRRLPEGMEVLKELDFLDLRVMEIRTEEQERISVMLPETRIFFTSPCNCMDDSLESEPAIDR